MPRFCAELVLVRNFGSFRYMQTGGYHFRLEEEWVAQPRGLDVWARRPDEPN